MTEKSTNDTENSFHEYRGNTRNDQILIFRKKSTGTVIMYISGRDIYAFVFFRVI